MKTLIDLLRTAQDDFPVRTALSMQSGLREDRWSYERLWLAARSIAYFFRSELGLKSGDRIIVWAPNCPQLVATYFGAMLARIIVVPLDPASTTAFIQRVAEKTEAMAMVAGFTAPEAITTRVIQLDALPFDTPAALPSDLPEADDVAEIVFTSGTTGTPKGVILTHRNVVASVEAVRTLLPARPYRLLSFLPLSHMLEQTVGLYVPLLLGSTIYYPTSRGSAVVLKTMKRHRITTLVVVPRVLTLLLQGIEREVDSRQKRRQWELAHRLAEHVPFSFRRLLFHDVHRALGSQLDFVISGGAHLESTLAATWERLGVRAIQGYGTTECAPIIATNSYWRRVPDSVGRPAPGVDVRLSSESEILVKGSNVTAGYWEDDERTRDAFTDGGWYRTGDLAELDAQGDLFLKGRLKDLIVLPSGLKIHPEDVESELQAETSIQDCVVLGVPDETGATTVHAVVIAEPPEIDKDRQRDIVGQAVRRANARLAPHQHVAQFTLWKQEDFPRTNLLKVKRFEVLAALEGARTSLPSQAPRRMATVDRQERLNRVLSSVSGISAESITPETDLSLDLHLDSLARVELAMFLEEELGVLVEDGDLAEVQTVGELEILAQRTGITAPEPILPMWSRTALATVLRSILQRLLVFPMHGRICRPFTVEGREHLNGIGTPILLIANHSSHFDTPTVLRALPSRLRRHVAVAAAADYFYRWRVVGFAVSLFLNTFPFSREGAVRSSLEHCGELIDSGWSVLIYPEGTRSTTGKLQSFRSGIGVLASQLRVPVIPVAIKGTYDVFPKGRQIPKRGAVIVKFGPPIKLSMGADWADATTTLEESMTRLVSRSEKVSNLAGQDHS